MPYITQKERRKFDDLEDQVFALDEISAGELNYLVTKLCNKYLERGLRYEHLNAVIGVLECAKNEIYRRIVVPYEDKKAQLNGDVYPVALLNP